MKKKMKMKDEKMKEKKTRKYEENKEVGRNEEREEEAEEEAEKKEAEENKNKEQERKKHILINSLNSVFTEATQNPFKPIYSIKTEPSNSTSHLTFRNFTTRNSIHQISDSPKNLSNQPLANKGY